MTPRYDSMDSSNNTTDSTNTTTTLLRNDLVATAAADLIRQLDLSYAEASAGIVTGARDAQEARRNAQVAAELARRYSSSTTHTSWQQDDDESVEPLRIPKIPIRPPSPVSTRVPELSRIQETGPVDMDDAMDELAASPPPTPSNFQTTWRNAASSPSSVALAQAHADEFLQVSLDLERTQEALEREQCAHQESQTNVKQLESRLSRVESQMACAHEDLETARESYGRQMDELQAMLREETERADAAQEDADAAIELAREKADAEHEMRYYLHQVLERNEEYQECLEAAMSSPSANDEEKNNRRKALVEAGRQLVMARSSPSPAKSSSAPMASPPQPVATKSATLKATALLRESGRRLGMPTEADESLDKLARRYSNFAETEIQHLRQEIRQLESLCALWETGSIGGPATTK